MNEIKSIYIAGKMYDFKWRNEFFDGYQKYDYHLKLDPGDKWPEYSGETVSGLYYTGPFYVDLCGGHCYQENEGSEHGNNIDSDLKEFARNNHGADLNDRRDEVQQWCLRAIDKADLVFAWIDCIDCYGTIAEIGYAKALGKKIWIAGPRRFHDLWFIYQMDEIYPIFANWETEGSTPHEIFKNRLHEYHRNHRHFDSPIEQAFWDAWIEMRSAQDKLSPRNIELEPQYPIEKYRVDFAHISTKTAIELDGFASHSSTEDIARDRKRQREIEEQGWHVIRFGGKEAHHDALGCVIEAYNWINKKLLGEQST